MVKIDYLNFKKTYIKEIPSHSYLTHGIHPFTAKLIPQIPRYFIERYTNKTDTVLDPFCGSGTTLLEAKLLSRNGIGIDIHPLAVLISKVKTQNINVSELKRAISLLNDQIRHSNNKVTFNFPNIDHWFSKKAKDELSKIVYSTNSLKTRNEFSGAVLNFIMVSLSSIIRKSSFADPRMAKTYKSKRMIERIENGWSPTPIQYFLDALDRNLGRVKSLMERLKDDNYTVDVFQGSAIRISSILSENQINKVDSIITSPPYINAQDYFRSYKLEVNWLDLLSPKEITSLKRMVIGSDILYGFDCNYALQNEVQLLKKTHLMISKKNKTKAAIVNKYFENMKTVIEESNKVLKRGGYLCLVTGDNNICEVDVKTGEILEEIAKNMGLKLVEISVDEIKDRALPPNRNHRGGVIQRERISIYMKE